jgi:putative methyltransferase (TIGR04325 family)
MQIGMTLKDMIRLITPPVFIHLAKRLCVDRPADNYGLSGDYRSWDEAMVASTGYDNAIILEKTRTALLKVNTGEAIYERDSVLFNEIQYSWPLLAGLMSVAARCGGRLNVIDFGGSLGSTYFQNRAFLSVLPEVRWNIVEQSNHVGIGKAYFEDDYLRFYAGISDCLADTQPNVVLLSSVLQYLECPYTVFDQILELSCDHIIIDRTPFWVGPTDRLCVQNVPPSIYPASYPSWIFSRQRFYEHLHQDWQNMVTFDNPDRIAGPIDFSYQGMIIVRSKHLS